MKCRSACSPLPTHLHLTDVKPQDVVVCQARRPYLVIVYQPWPINKDWAPLQGDAHYTRVVKTGRACLVCALAWQHVQRSHQRWRSLNLLIKADVGAGAVLPDDLHLAMRHRVGEQPAHVRHLPPPDAV